MSWTKTKNPETFTILLQFRLVAETGAAPGQLENE